MLIGVFIRYFKTYKGINFIPITDESNFCGLLGNNGIGKSSVLEALDCFFNGRAWNFNVATKKSGVNSTVPHIVPVFLIERSKFTGEDFEKAKILNHVAVELDVDDFNLSVRGHLDGFRNLISNLIKNINIDDYFVIPIGVDYKSNLSLSIFNCKYVVNKVLKDSSGESLSSLNDSQLLFFKSLLDKIKSLFEYIYIPREIDPELFTKLETQEIQVLMGETLNEILENRVTSSKITEINNSLNEFIKELSDELGIYSYRTPTDRQQNLRKNDVYNLIIDAFFKIRKLHKKQGDNWIEIGELSSGEKQKAIIDVAHKFLINHRKKGSNLIVAIDEPESSLHMSACFDQFDALYDISRSCRQVIFSSHWYGFLPTIEKGSVSIISKEKGDHVFDTINLDNYREQIRQSIRQTKNKMPYDIRLKSINDFVQSVITSSMSKYPYNWLICEGSSEKIYFSKYFSDLVEDKKLRIVPVGGAGEIKKIYSYISASYEDFKDDILGKIILISDTDEQLVRYETRVNKNLFCYRIVNCSKEKKTKLVNINSNPVSPKTEIEDSLNGLLFFKTLKGFLDKGFSELSFLDSIDDIPEFESFFSLDIKQSERMLIECFFDSGNNKYEFAKAYCEGLSDEYKVPDWINEIRGILQ